MNPPPAPQFSAASVANRRRHSARELARLPIVPCRAPTPWSAMVRAREWISQPCPMRTAHRNAFAAGCVCCYRLAGCGCDPPPRQMRVLATAGYPSRPRPPPAASRFNGLRGATELEWKRSSNTWRTGPAPVGISVATTLLGCFLRPEPWRR